VALTCSVNGTILEWVPSRNIIDTIVTFSQDGSVGDGFSEPAINCDRGAGTVRASGVLEVIDLGDPDFPICNSTMILTPSPCECISFNVTCKSNTTTNFKSIRFQVAGESSMGVYIVHNYYTEY
jgi:hypothetical protein